MLLRDKVIAIYCLVDDLLLACDHHTAEGCRCSDAEIITTALVSALLFKGNQSLALEYMRTHNMAATLPLKSGFTKRLHRLAALLYSLFRQMGAIIKELNCSGSYILDSFPLAVCHNIRISRCKLFKGEAYRGFCASKHQYFYGVKVQVITTAGGIPVECCFVPGSEHDSEAISQLLWDFEPGDRIYDDSGYTCYAFEDIAADAGIDILTARRKNTKRKDQPYEAYLKDYYRKHIETAFSGITNLMPKAMHAVTPEGFFIKALLFVMAYQFSQLIQPL
jgi:Transposase DDE domain